MLGVSGAAAAVEQPHESGGGSSEVGASSSIPGGGMDDIDRSGGGGGGNRWPRQETLALLKIRSEMDVAFRDSSLKGPLWEEVSRKMAELGFQRNPKKCKEKFENVYKYHRRTKDGRSSKPDGKTYRFFDQLEALENTPPISFTPPPPRPQPPTIAAPSIPSNLQMPPSHITVSSGSPTPLTVVHPNTTSSQAAHVNQINSSPFQPSQPPLLPPAAINAAPQTHNFQPSIHLPHVSTSFLSGSTSSSTSSDEDIQRRRGKKRKWKDFFERLMTEVAAKQEELQKKFLDTLEKRERDRMAREEAWRAQEMARLNREHDLLVQERSMAAAKDAAVIAFLQKVTDQQNLQIPFGNNTPPPQVPLPVQPPTGNPQPPRQPPPPMTQQPNAPTTPAVAPQAPPPPPPAVTVTPTKLMDASKTDNGGDNFLSASSSRWPKTEIEALIKLRTNLDIKYQESGPKGPLWEEISAAMGKLGYSRNAKRCKEKWENINKYFKKVKESNRKRPEDSKTCPYFHQLNAIYNERAKTDVTIPAAVYAAKLENPIAPIMARPEQQWPLPPEQQHHHQTNEDDSDHDDMDEGEDDEEEDDGGGYEMVKNMQPSSVTNTVE